MKNIKIIMPVIAVIIAGFFGAASYAASVPADYDPAANYPDLVWTSEGFRPSDGVDLYEGGKFHKSKTLPYYIEGDFVVGDNMCYPKKPQQNYVEDFDKFYVHAYTTHPEESNKIINTNTSIYNYTRPTPNVINGGKNIAFTFPIINCLCINVNENCDDTTTDSGTIHPGTETEYTTPVPLPAAGFLLFTSLGLLFRKSLPFFT